MGKLKYKDKKGVPPESMEVFVRLAERRYHEFDNNNYIVDRESDNAVTLVHNNNEINVIISMIRIIKDNIKDLFSSQLSKWGVGSKYSLARIGERVTIQSQELHHLMKSTIRVDHKEKEFKYFKRVEDGVPGAHYVHIQVDELNDINLFADEYLKIDNTKIKEFQNALAHTYYFYIVGFSKFLERVIQLLRLRFADKLPQYDELIASLKEKDEAKRVSITVNNCHLRSLYNIIDQYATKAQDVFVFTLTFNTEKDKFDTAEIGDHKLRCFVLGVIFYYPFEREHETKPTPFPEFGQSQRDSDEALVEYYWVGRLLPKVSNSSMGTPGFMKPKQQRNRKIPNQCYKRVKGFFFLNRAFTPNQNKTDFVDDQNTVIQQELRKHLSNPDLSNSYMQWLSNCHEKDMEYIFEENLSRDTLKDQVFRHYFAKLKIPLTSGNLQLSVGNFVKLVKNSTTPKTAEILFGEISKFSFKSLSENHITQKGVLKTTIYILPYRFNQKCKENSYLLEEYTVTLENLNSYLDEKDTLVDNLKMEFFQLSTPNEKDKKQILDNSVNIARDKDEFSVHIRISGPGKPIPSKDLRNLKIYVSLEEKLIVQSSSNITQNFFHIIIPTKHIFNVKNNPDQTDCQLSIQAVVNDTVEAIPLIGTYLVVNFKPGDPYRVELTSEMKQLKLQHTYEFQIKFYDKSNYPINVPNDIKNRVEKKSDSGFKLKIKSSSKNKFLCEESYNMGNNVSYIRCLVTLELVDGGQLNNLRGEEIELELETKMDIMNNSLSLLILPGKFYRSALSLNDEVINHDHYSIDAILFDKWGNKFENLDTKYSFLYEGNDSLKPTVRVNSNIFYHGNSIKKDLNNEWSWKGIPVYIRGNKVYYSSCFGNGILYQVILHLLTFELSIN